MDSGNALVLTWPAHGSQPASGVQGTGACTRAVGVAPAPEPSVAPTLSHPVPQLRPLPSSSHLSLCPARGALDTKPAPSDGSGCALRPEVLILLHQTPGQGRAAALVGPPPKAPGSRQQEKWGSREGAGGPLPAVGAHCGGDLGPVPYPLAIHALDPG